MNPRTGMLAHMRAVFARDVRLAVRKPAEVATPIIFFVIVTSLFPLGIGPEPAKLATIAPGVLWVAALLATMLSLGRLFSADHADGTLEQLLLTPQPLTALIYPKLLAHWLTAGLPLVLLSPLLALQLHLPVNGMWTLMLTLLLGTPILSCIGAIGAALTLGVRGGGVLLSLLVLPLYTPVLIFGASAVAQAVQGLSAEAFISIESAMLVVALGFAPWVTAQALAISLD
jgi:heme exporter protein B